MFSRLSSFVDSAKDAAKDAAKSVQAFASKPDAPAAAAPPPAGPASPTTKVAAAAASSPDAEPSRFSSFLDSAKNAAQSAHDFAVKKVQDLAAPTAIPAEHSPNSSSSSALPPPVAPSSTAASVSPPAASVFATPAAAAATTPSDASQPPAWTDGESCSKCKAAFNFLIRKHHCRFVAHCPLDLRFHPENILNHHPGVCFIVMRSETAAWSFAIRALHTLSRCRNSNWSTPCECAHRAMTPLFPRAHSNGRRRPR
jgi:hypothetical protein